MTSWDALNTTAPRQRIRGGEIPQPGPLTWREELKARERLNSAPDVAPAPAEPNPAVWQILGFPIDMDAMFAGALLVPMLFIANWGTMAAAMIAGLIPLYLFVRRDGLGPMLLTRSLLFLVPALALMSVVWSEAPRESFKFAAELLLTVIAGLLISSARNQEAVIRALAAAFAVYIAVAVMTGGHIAVGVGEGGEALSGMTGSKNLLADVASTGMIISLATFAMAAKRKNWLWMAFTVGAMGLELYAVIAARSAGAILGLAIGMAAYGGLLTLIAAGTVVRAWLTSVLAVVLVGIGMNFTWLSQLMIQTAADIFDKDSTLTGRTYLWYRAADLIHEKPILGRGFQAFWLQGNTDAEGLWRYFGISGRAGFTFHNTGVEILVTLGWLGVAVIGTVVVASTIVLIRRFVVRPNLAMVCWTALFLYQLSRMPIESIGLAPFYFSTALAFAALGAAWAGGEPRKLAAVRAPYGPPPPRIVQAWPVEEVPGPPASDQGTEPAAAPRRLRAVEAKGRR